MAELTNNTARTPWATRQTVAQFRAIAWLRWRLLLNGLRRKGATGEIVAAVLVYPSVAAIALLPIVGAGVAAAIFTAHGHLAHISWLLWGAFVLGILLSINLGRPGTTFDPNQLIRFPLRLREFVSIRLFFGLLAPANVLVTLISLAIAVGIGCVEPRLWIYALMALGVFAATCVFFSRMVFAWVDRWLSTRRAREVFTLLIFAVSIGFQWLNVSYNPAYNHHRSNPHLHHHVSAVVSFYQAAHPWLVYFPPELTGSALVAAHRDAPFAWLGYVFGSVLFAAAFLAVFAVRMRTEFRGEVLSDVANAVPPARKNERTAIAVPIASPEAFHRESPRAAIFAVLRKELLYVRRNTGLFYSLIVPVVMVFLFANRLSLRGHTDWVLPAAIAYALFGIVPLSYNVFGLEGTGAQLYFMAPARLRDVFLAKNLMNVALAVLEISVVLAVLAYLTGRLPLRMAVLSVLWAAATLLASMALGNLRSVSAPKRIEFTKAAGKQASPLSAFLAMGVLMVFAAVGAALFLLARVLHMDWLLLPVFAALLAVSVALYIFGLQHVERFALEHRESLFSELSKS